MVILYKDLKFERRNASFFSHCSSETKGSVSFQAASRCSELLFPEIR